MVETVKNWWELLGSKAENKRLHKGFRLGGRRGFKLPWLRICFPSRMSNEGRGRGRIKFWYNSIFILERLRNKNSALNCSEGESSSLLPILRGVYVNDRPYESNSDRGCEFWTKNFLFEFLILKYCKLNVYDQYREKYKNVLMETVMSEITIFPLRFESNYLKSSFIINNKYRRNFFHY